jgi:hypothetical protein
VITLIRQGAILIPHAFTHGTLVKHGKGGMVQVQWDGDASPVNSYWKHIEYSDENLLEGTSEGQPPAKRARKLNSMVARSAPGQVYEQIALELTLPPWHEPLHTLALIERTTVGEKV